MLTILCIFSAGAASVAATQASKPPQNGIPAQAKEFDPLQDKKADKVAKDRAQNEQAEMKGAVGPTPPPASASGVAAAAMMQTSMAQQQPQPVQRKYLSKFKLFENQKLFIFMYYVFF